MFLLRLIQSNNLQRHVNKNQLFSGTSVNRHFFTTVNYSSLLKNYLFHSNLKIFANKNVNLNCNNSCNCFMRTYARMDGKRKTGKSLNDFGDKKIQKRKIDMNKCCTAIFKHLSKDPKFILNAACTNKISNVKNKDSSNEITITPKSHDVLNHSHRRDYFQKVVLNSLRKDSKKYQISDVESSRLDSYSFPGQSSSISDAECRIFSSFDPDLFSNPRLISDDPKVIFHNFYQNVANRLNSSEFLLGSPYYNYKHGLWFCTYVIHWPRLRPFIGEAINKKGAGHNSAKLAVEWLRENNFMDDRAKPILRHDAKQHKINGRLLQSRRSVLLDNKVRYHTTSSRINLREKSINEEIKNVRTLFPTPKNTLHNFFQILCFELKQDNLKVVPQYKIIKEKSTTSWMCTYNLKWPELMKFSEVAQTKHEASYKAALSALSWLVENKKITKDGKPIVYGKEEVKEITKQTYPALALNNFVRDRLSCIGDLYENNLKDQLAIDGDVNTSCSEDEMEVFDEKWPKLDANVRRGESMRFQHYQAKEPTQLPISDYKNQIIETLQKNQVLIIKGEPGCGKSTRVPQYVLESWFREETDQQCRIVVTQPRRIAAVALAERVASERGEMVGNTVGFHIRLHSNFNNRTGRIMYCTTGILLRRLQQDPNVSDCSHIILDEAHERDVNTDLLMNLIRHALNLNPNLKLIVMSATLEAKLFQDYFDNAAVIHIPGFTYPVKQHFLGESENLPKTHQMCAGNTPSVIHEEVVQVLKHIHKNRPEGAILCFLPGWDEITKVLNLIPQNRNVQVMCLHSKLDMTEQRKIFSRPPPGVRKIILATNIAETSITVDDVVYVVDTGIHKEERFDAEKGINCIDNYWISQASATQRKGRAGRCQPGESYHLYPKSKHNEFQPHSIPEILRTSLTKIVLDSKVYSNNMNSIEFLEQLICPPEKSSIERAVEELKELELLDENENLTPLGRTLSEFQLEPKLSKAMVNAVIFKCVTPIVDIATLFSADSPIFSKTLGGLGEIKEIKMKFSKNSDHLSVMRIYEMWLDYVEKGDFDSAYRFCSDKGLIEAKMKTIRKLSEIHFDYLRKGLKNILQLADDFSDNDELVKAVLLSGVGNVLQHRSWDIVKGRMKMTNVLLTKHNQKATLTTESINSRKGKFPSDFLLYINEMLSNLRHTTIVRETSVISAIAVLLFKNGQLEIEEIDAKNRSEKVPSDDQVLLRLRGTKMGFFCDRKQALILKRCKEALNDCVKYHIYQLTKGADYNEEVCFYWNEILRNLNDILDSQNLNDDLDNM